MSSQSSLTTQSDATRGRSSSKARSRSPFNPPPVPNAMEMMRSAVAGAFLALAVGLQRPPFFVSIFLPIRMAAFRKS